MSIFADLASLLDLSPYSGHPAMTEQSPISAMLAGADAALGARTEPSTAVAAALAAPPAAPTTTPYSTHSLTMLRQLDEQRQHFHDVAGELDAEIAALSQKRDDALHAAAMAEAGMRAMEGAS